jgi:hypothetical protein
MRETVKKKRKMRSQLLRREGISIRRWIRNSSFEIKYVLWNRERLIMMIVIK